MQLLKKRVVVKLNEGQYLLINPYSGLADILDEETLQMLSSGNFDPHEETIAGLKRRGHLLEEGEEEDLFRHMYSLSEQLHEEFSKHNLHVVMPTYECNLQCPYCFERHLYRKDVKWKTTMDEKTVDCLFEAVLSLDSETEGEKCIVFYGGEPLQVKNYSIIEYILKKGDELGYSFKVVTNGADFYHFVPLLSQFNILKTQITIDGPREVHDRRRFRKGGKGTFDDIVRGIDLALDYDLPVGIRINVDSANMGHLPEFAEYYREKGWYPKVYAFATNVHGAECTSYSSLISVEEFTKELIDLFLTDERMDVLFQTFRYPNVLLEHLFAGEPFKPRFWACGSHTSIFIYDAVGDIYPCYEAVGEEVHKVGEYKPVLKFNDRFDHWRKRTVFTIPECKECNLAFFCGGGCAHRAYDAAGSIYSPMCDKTKFSVEYEVPYLYQVMKEKKKSLSEVRDWYFE